MTFEPILASLIVCLAGFVQATVIIGFAMIAVPLLVLVDLTYAPGPSLLVMLFLSVSMAQGRAARSSAGLASWREALRTG